MDNVPEARFSVSFLGPVVSFTVALISLGITSLTQFRGLFYETASSSTSLASIFKYEKDINVFNIASRSTFDKISPFEFTSESAWNRTIWPLISSSEFYSGFEKVEPEAWVPTHTHETEEILIILSGFANVYDSYGYPTKVSSGSMVHFKKNVKHSIQNTQLNDPLLLVWVLPVRFGYQQFLFKPKYSNDKF